MEFLDQIVEKIAQFLQEKEINIGKDELMKVLSSVPLSPSTPPPSTTHSSSGGCIYTANRGKNKNIACGEPTIPDFDYCKDCILRTCVRKKLGLEPITEKAPVKRKKKETLPSLSSQFKFSGASKTFIDKQSINLKLEPLDKNGHYYFPGENFILRKEPNGTYLVLGFGEEEVERPLNEKERTKALELGLRVLAEVEE